MQILNQIKRFETENIKKLNMTDKTLQQLAQALETAQQNLDLASERIRAIDDVEEKFQQYLERDRLIEELHRCQNAIAAHQAGQVRELEEQRTNQFFLRPR